MSSVREFESALMARRVASRYLTASPKDEVNHVMTEVMAAVEKHLGKEKLTAIFSDPEAAPKSPLKQIQTTLVFATSDLASDVKTLQQAPGHKVMQFQHGPGGKLGMHPPKMSPEAAEWYSNQTDAVQFTMARKVLDAMAKSLGVHDFDRKRTVFANKKFKPGDEVRVDTKGRSGFDGDTGEIDKYIPFGVYYVHLKKHGYQSLSEEYLHKV